MSVAEATRTFAAGVSFEGAHPTVDTVVLVGTTIHRVAIQPPAC